MCVNLAIKEIGSQSGQFTAGEALACMMATIGEMVYVKTIFEQIYGDAVNNIPMIVFTDSRNLQQAVYSTSLVEDAWSIPDIAIIQEAVEMGTISCLKRVRKEIMLANCLTKAGASADGLMDVLQTGTQWAQNRQKW